MMEENKLWKEVQIQVPWGHLAGRWYGDQQRRPILALHGWLDNCGSFATIAPLLMTYCSLLCIDMPGHGYSSHLPPGIIYNKLEYAAIILRIMKAYKWEKVSLLGHSMGGSVIFDFASYHPTRVDMIISLDIVKSLFVSRVDIHPQYIHHAMERALIENERLVHQSPLSEAPSYSFEECEYLLFEGSNQSVHLDKCRFILERNISRSSKYPSKFYFSRDGRVKSLFEFSVTSGLLLEMTRRICKAQIPYIVIKAGDSIEINDSVKEVIKMLEKNNPNFEMHELAGERHHLHLNNPEPVAQLIIEFLKKHPQTQSEASQIGAAKL